MEKSKGSKFYNSFFDFHPMINFLYFTFVLLCSMFFMHPVFLGISLVCSLTYSMYVKGLENNKHLLYMLPMFLLILVFNPLFNHRGDTVLFMSFLGAVTLESMLFGLASAVMLICVILWFSCYNVVMTSDKFIYLFSKIIPRLSLLFSMVLRFVPHFVNQFKKIADAQRCMGKDYTTGTLKTKVKNFATILSILIAWSLENSMETANSMKARGYGIGTRTHYHNYRFRTSDKTVLGILSFLAVVITFGCFIGETSVNYFPSIVVNPLTLNSLLVYFSYFLFCFMPIIVNVWEEIRWKRLNWNV